MNEIIITNTNGQLTTSSLGVAETFGKQHNHIIRDIENLISEGVVQNWTYPLFIEKTYQHPQNKQWYKCYDITRDGFSLLVMGFTGKKALEWKLKYIEAFNAMEQKLRNGYGGINLEEIIAKTVAVAVSETIKVVIPLLNQPAPETDKSSDTQKHIRKKYRYSTPSKISMLEPELKQKVDEMIVSGEYSCQQIANFIMNNSDIEISQMAVNRYKRINFI